MKNGKPHCYLYHYTFPFDEAKLPVDKVLVEYLNLIWESIKEQIQNDSESKESLSTISLSQFRLVVRGGDVAEGNKSRLAFNLLNHNEIDLTNKLSNNEYALFLYKEFIKRGTIILQPVFKMAKSKADRKALTTNRLVEYPGLWIRYSCITKNTTLGNYWKSESGKFNVGYLQFNLNSIPVQLQWQMQPQQINNFKIQCDDEEREVFEQALSLMEQINPLFTSETYPIKDWYTFISTNVKKTLDFDETKDDIERNDEKKGKKSTNKNKRDFKLLDDEDVLDENDEENSKTTATALSHLRKLLKTDTISKDVKSSLHDDDDDDFHHSDDPYKESITTSHTTWSIPSEKEKDNEKTKKEEMRTIESDLMSLSSTSSNPSVMITEHKVCNLLSQEKCMTFTELIENFLPEPKHLQTKEIKYNIAQELATILTRSNIEGKMICGEAWIKISWH
ncbi:unnamed protein product [Rotaria sp. Silwood2]|nr:unnamed protein product [Rotaria sp. Silwood2]CAF4297002.1 unnamed protein product [Rotaria sp. Silwood2]